MSGAATNWPALSYLEGLRPAPGENVELALLASYSADLGSIGAALLALAGKDTDAGRGSPSDFVDAVEKLRGKVRIIIQQGRLAKMRRTPRIATVLDQFVREVDFNEAHQSWHPKAALIRTRSAEGKVGWRLWIGSRNLTENVNRDIGLLLLSGRKGGAIIPGVEKLARSLTDRAALRGVRPASVGKAIAKVAWRAPPGVRVERILWSEGKGDQKVPSPSAEADEVVVVSPFIDKTFLAQQTRKTSNHTRRVLLTTMREIERIGPSLEKFDDLLAMDAPDYPISDPEADPDSTSTESGTDLADDEEEEVGRGLHAKLLFMRSGQTRRIWLGSANATMRAWTGRNVEVTAELVVKEAVEKGLKGLLGSARLVEAPRAEHSPDAEVLEDEALERARSQVAARWASQLSFDNEVAHLTHCSELYPFGPHPDEPDIALKVGTLHGDLVAWPRGQTSLPLGQQPFAERSEFVRLRVSREEKGLSWLQRAPANPSFGEDRDHAAFVRFLGARGFLLWLAGLLADDERDGEGDWTNDESRGQPDIGMNAVLDSSLPTLEEILAAWARDPEKFRDIERRVSQYLPAVLEEANRETPETAELLRRFDDLWSKLRSGLGIVQFKGKRS